MPPGAGVTALTVRPAITFVSFWFLGTSLFYWPVPRAGVNPRPKRVQFRHELSLSSLTIVAWAGFPVFAGARVDPHRHVPHLFGVTGNAHILGGHVERVTRRQLRIGKNRRGLPGGEDSGKK